MAYELCVAVAMLAVALYYYATAPYSFWKHKRIYYLQPKLFFGSMKESMLLRRSVHESMADIYNQLEGHRFAGYYEGRRAALMIRDPDLINDVMIRDFEHFHDRPRLQTRNPDYMEESLMQLRGARWRHMKQYFGTAFTSGKLKAMHQLVNECGQQMSAYVTRRGDGDHEMKKLFVRFTLEVIGCCVFGVQCGSFERDTEFVAAASQYNEVSRLKGACFFALLFLVPKLAFYLPISFFNEKAAGELLKILKSVKAQRRANWDEKRNDFLQLMMELPLAIREKMQAGDDDTVVDAQLMIFLIAGFETSSSLLTCTSYELALHQDCQDKAREEITRVLAKHGGQCTYEALQDMHYLEMVLLEALRKHPPIPTLHRNCTNPWRIPGTDVTLERGTVVSVSIMGLHYDPQYYPRPQEFDPNRFLPEAKDSRPNNVYLPFGSGPRYCIGKRFAMMNSKVALVTLLKDYRINKCDKTEVPYVLNPSAFVLKPKNGVYLNISKIK